MIMFFTYGQGRFSKGDQDWSGEIILGEHKLYLREGAEELTATFVPLEKIARLKRAGSQLELFVYLSQTVQYTVIIRASAAKVRELCKDLVSARGFKKQFLKNEWVDDSIF